MGDVSALGLAGYDNALVLGRATADDGESADAQTILCYAIVQALRQKHKHRQRTSLLAELMVSLTRARARSRVVSSLPGTS